MTAGREMELLHTGHGMQAAALMARSTWTTSSASQLNLDVVYAGNTTPNHLQQAGMAGRTQTGRLATATAQQRMGNTSRTDR